MDIDGLIQKLKEYNLEKYEAQFVSLARPSIRLFLEKDDDSELPLGTSKIGGLPDLPTSITWPYETKRPPSDRDRHSRPDVVNKTLGPLSFIAQIDFSQVSPLDEESLFPKSGFLYFFYTADQDVWGFDPRDHSGFKVIFFEGGRSELMRRDFPEGLDKYSRFTACRLNAISEVSLPTSYQLRPAFETDVEFDLYEEKIIGDGLINKMLGYANPVQNEMELECEMVANGLYTGTSEAYRDPRRAEFEERSSEWRLLLQVDSNDDCGMMWGDVGRIYFWIRKDDLLNKRFDNCWLIYQCC